MIDSGLNVKKFKCKTNERKLCKLDVTSKFPLLKVSWVTCNKENLFIFLISVDGGWGGWSQWSAQCSVTCGQGVRTRDRHCSNPPPAHRGAACVGDAFDSQACQQPDCPGKLRNIIFFKNLNYLRYKTLYVFACLGCFFVFTIFVPIYNFSLICWNHHYTVPVKGCKFLPKLGTHVQWAMRVL